VTTTERAEIWLNVVQAWDHRDEGWDLQVFVSLCTASDAWRQRLLSSATTDDHDGNGDDDGDKDNNGSDDGVEGDKESNKDDDNKKAECTKKGRPLRLVLLDYYRSRGEINDTPSVRFGMLRKIWQCVGLAGERADGEGADDGEDGEADGEGEGENQQQQQQWNGTEVLTTLLACLGFAWKDDVELIWEDCGEEDDANAAEGEGEVTLFEDHAINGGMFRTCKHKSEVLSDWREQVEQLSSLLEANMRSAPNEVRRL
jgi:hypothetical protein